MRLFLAALLFIASYYYCFCQATTSYSWSGYTSGSTSYTVAPTVTGTVGSMTTSITYGSSGSAWISGSGSPKYVTAGTSTFASNSNCVGTGLLLAVDWATNTSANAVTLTMNFPECVAGPVTFSIYDLNAGTMNTFGDWVAITPTSTPAVAPTRSGCSFYSSSASGSTLTIKAGNAATANETGCACGSTTVSVGNSSTKISSISIKYYPDPQAYNTGSNNPSYQYIVIGNVTVPNAGCSLLPIELLSFNSACSSGIKTFTWETASELNNDYFIIERSKDGMLFEEAAQIDGAGTTSIKTAYEYTLDETENEFSYYRLKQVDFDGSFDYSEIIASACSSTNNDLILYPNPASSESVVSFSSAEESAGRLELVDLAGRLVSNENIEIKKGKNNAFINLLQITDGTYFVRIIDEASGKIFPVKKLSVQKSFAAE